MGISAAVARSTLADANESRDWRISLRWAAAESVPETVITAICLLETKSVESPLMRLVARQN